MARVIHQSDARRLGLPGRSALDLVSAATGATSLTLRLVEIPPAGPGAAPRGPHLHDGCEECIFVLSGSGRLSAAGADHEVAAGDTIFVPPGEPHVTRNTGGSPLMLLCFFPVADITRLSRELTGPDSPMTS